MEVDETFHNCWEVCVSMFGANCSVKNNEVKFEPGLHELLVNITESLTFEDPGLFPNMFITSESRGDMDHGYVWILNELIFITAHDQTHAFKAGNLTLQKELLSASLMKQPWWTKKVLEIYCKILSKTCEQNQVPSGGLEIKITDNETYKLKLATLNYKKIFVTSTNALNDITECCLHLLTHGIIIMCNMDQEFVEMASREVFKVLYKKNMRLKWLAIYYFNKLAKSIDHFSSETRLKILKVYESLFNIYNNLPHWISNSDEIRTKDLKTYNSFVKKFFVEVSPLNIPYTNEEQYRLLKILFNILQTYFKHQDLIEIDLMENLIVYLKNLLPNFYEQINYVEDIQSEIQNLFQFIPKILKLISLFDFNILTEIQCYNSFERDLLRSNSTWKCLHDFLVEKITKLTKVHITNDLIYTLGVIEAIFRLINEVDYKFLVQHQKRHITLGNQCFCQLIDSNTVEQDFLQDYGADWDLKNISLTYFHENCNCLMEKILSTVSSRNDLNEDVLVIFINIFQHFLQKSTFAKDLNENLKTTMISIIVSPFYNLFKSMPGLSTNSSFIKFVNQLPANIRFLFEKTDMDKVCLRGLQLACLQCLSQLNMAAIHPMLPDLHKQIFQLIQNQGDVDLKQGFVKYFLGCLINNIENTEYYIKMFWELSNPIDLEICPSYIAVLKDLICIMQKNCLVSVEKSGGLFAVQVTCLCCRNDEDDFEVPTIEDLKRKILIDSNSCLVSLSSMKISTTKIQVPDFYFKVQNNETKCRLIELIPTYLNHMKEREYIVNDDDPNQEVLWISLFCDKNKSVLDTLNRNLKVILQSIDGIQTTEKEKSDFNLACIKQLLELVHANLDSKDQKLQSLTVNIVFNFGKNVKSDEVLLHSFRLLTYYMICNTSLVISESYLLASKLCKLKNVAPNSLFSWYQQSAMQVVVSAALSNFMDDVPLLTSLKTFANCLGFEDATDFIRTHFRFMIAILLPYCIKNTKLLPVLSEIYNVMNLDLARVLSLSFLKVYPYIYFNEKAEVTNDCVDFILENTGCTLFKLLDQRTMIYEFLVYFHKCPEFVMHALKSLLSGDGHAFNSSKAVEFISEKFLAVMNYFNTSVWNDPRDLVERSLKKEALLSLGDIIRLLSAQYLTPFHFKIMAILNSAYAVKDVNLKGTCLEVWKIFIRTADVSSLGPIISTIFISLEPFLESYPVEVNEIYKYLVIDNKNLLSLHILDLFFVDSILVDNSIKSTIKSQMERQRNEETFLEKCHRYIERINHEDSKVRTYALQYFKKLLEGNRTELNHMIVGQIFINPLIEKMLEVLIKNCKSDNRELQLIASRCLGEIGAVEPGLLAPNYAPQYPISAYSADSDEFAILALKELCRSFHQQSNYKHTDSFSLAIQEILKARKVNPELNQNMEVWNVVPERMRPFVQPLLTSNYTSIAMDSSRFQNHPLFGTNLSNLNEWVYLWASKLLEKVSSQVIKDLLNGIKPSMRVDKHISSLFLPYFILHSIESTDSEDHQLIYEELNSIFEIVLHHEEETGKARTECTPPEEKSHYYLKCFIYEPSRKREITESIHETALKCSKMIFEMLDFLENFQRTRDKRDTKIYADISQLLKRFDNKLLAEVNFKCGEYARALIYLESYIRENPEERLQKELIFLGKIYAELGDVDSVEGLKYVKNEELSLDEQILINNVTGRLSESTACFERMLQIGNVSIADVKNAVNCYVGLNQPETALLVSNSVLKELFEETSSSLSHEIQAEPLWRLGRFEELEELLEDPEDTESENFGLNCGKLFLKFQNNDNDGFKRELENTRMAILKMFKSSETKQGAYRKEYPEVIKIHIISEFEKAGEYIVKLQENNNFNAACSILKEFVEDWNARLEVLQPTPNTMEPILCIRRILLGETKILLKKIFSQSDHERLSALVDTEIGKLWIKSTEYACKYKMFQQAHQYFFSADIYKPKNLFLEKAKFFWEKGDQINAFKILDRGTSELLQLNQDQNSESTSSKRDSFEHLPEDEKKLYAEGKLLVAQYNAEAGHVGFDKNIAFFKEAIKAHKECEKSNLLFAAYLEKKYSFQESGLSKREKDSHQYEIMTYYCQSMCFGCDFVYQSMPRMLAIWLDTTSVTTSDKNSLEIYAKMNRTAEKLCKRLEPYYFFTAFSQLASRICHPNQDVYFVIKTIIVTLIQAFPQQSLWMLLSIYKSSYSNRVKRCREIFQDERLRKSNVFKLIQDFNTLAEKLIELSSKPISSSTSVSLRDIVPELPNLLRSGKLCDIVIPLERNLQQVRDCHQKCFTFPNQFVYIHSVDNQVEILRSLQKPRKIKILGSDGNTYNILMKFKDDLRRDYRFLEFNNVVREYLKKDPEARHRKLNIRTYTVIPLNEESGLIEWVPNLRTYKELLNQQYSKSGRKIPTLGSLRDMAIERKSPEEQKEIYLDLLEMHQPVLDDWFRQQFPNPHNYFQARSAYVKSTAVMSIIGYIMGLGDRHGENILFDTSSGDTVHVDFNCLFNRGEKLGVPELVPFRLTRNMIHAMGPLGTEGLFRKCCEITLRVLQKEKNTLMSYLKPFVYDPLLTWEKIPEGSRIERTERTDPISTTYVKSIEQRLNGIVKKYKGTSSIPLSVEGQVDFVIQEATNIDNLAAMFYGWSSFM